MIKNKAAWVTRLRAEVVEVEIESLDDASRDQNRRTPCTKREGENLVMSCMFKQRTAARYPVAVSTKRTGKMILHHRRTCLFLRLCRGASRPGKKHASAVTLALGAGRGEEHGTHARGRSRRRVVVMVLRLRKREARRRVQAKQRVASDAAYGLGACALARAPRRGSGKLVALPL